MVDRAGAAFHVIHVSIRVIAFLQKASVQFLDPQPQAVEVAFVLVASHHFVRVINDAELQLHRAQSVRARQVIQLVADRLEQALLAAMQEVALLDVRAKTQPSPRGLELAAPVVLHFEIVAAREAELHRVLAHRIAPHAATATEPDVIIDLAVHDHGAGPEIIVAAIFVVRQTGRPADGFGKLVALGEELIDRQAAHLLRVDREGRAIRAAGPGLHRARPGRHAVVAEVGEVRLRVIGVGHADGARAGVGHRDAIANEPAMRLHRRGDLGGERVVADQQIAVRARIIHRDGNPVRQIRVGRIGQLDVVAGIHDLVFERDRAHAVRVRDSRGDLHRHAAGRLLGRVRNLTDLRRRIVGEDGIDRAWRGVDTAAAAGLPDEPRVEKEVAAATQRGARVVGLDGDGV